MVNHYIHLIAILIKFSLHYRLKNEVFKPQSNKSPLVNSYILFQPKEPYLFLS